MGATLSKLAGWDTTPVQPVLASEAMLAVDAPSITEAPPILEPVVEVPLIQSSGPAFSQTAQGAQNFAAPIYGGTFIQNNQQDASAQDQNLSKRTPNTLKWLLEGSMFQWWLETQGAVLWGTGMPGAGKTTLASVVIQGSEDRAQESSDICVGFVYCRYTEPMKVRDILAALARQLLERYCHLLPVIEPLYAKHDLQRTKPTQSELIDVIRKICSRFRIARLFIDGLDEVLYDEQFDLLDTLKSVPANFFITSRPLLELNHILPDVKMFDIAAQNTDIELLISQHIDRNPALQKVLATDEQRARVVKKICESSHGMFLHASLMVEAASHCTSSGRVMEQLDKLPAKLDVLYHEAFKRIEMQPEEYAALARRVLLWVVFAYQPLAVDDLQYAVASNRIVDWAAPDDNLVPESLLISVCCGLIVIEHRIDPGLLIDDPSNRIVRLVHYTALDALKRLFLGRATSPHCLLAEVCIERLINCSVPHNQPQYQPRGAFYRKPLDQKPLLDYAYESWHLHAAESLQRPARSDGLPVASILHFLVMCEAYPAFENSLSKFDYFAAPIHLVVYYHLPTLLRLIDPEVNKLTKEGRTPLSLAAWRNDAVIAELLLKMEGINLDCQDEGGNTAFLVAAKKGSVDVAKTLLLDPRIDLHRRNKEGESALHCALRGGSSSSHTATALHLIATGININSADNCGRTLLMLAYSHPVRLLDKLAQHPDIDFLKRDKDGLTPLMYACRWGRSLAVQWYLRLPRADAKDHLGNCALAHRAQQWDLSCLTTSEDLISDFRALVEAGLDVNAKNAEGFTALMYAVRFGQTSMARALLQLEGVDVNLEDGEGRALLVVACDALINYLDFAFKDALQILDLLLQHPSVDINAKSRHGVSAVAYAVARGVLDTAADVFLAASHCLNKFPARPDSRQELLRRTGPLHEVPELAVHVQPEGHPKNQHPGTWARVVVTGRQLPYPPGFGLSFRRISASGEDNYRRCLEYSEGVGFGFPWQYGRISEKHACCARLLLKHPDIDDHGFGFLR
ncbi:ankyrin repeat-containing domain protein [Coprinopsis sp. MPI-PUGE-AT-0042]|nr:ankyrin repeat-containing domain protein [Coprinopsis sp. MPI-PUGE-AT-0042]